MVIIFFDYILVLRSKFCVQSSVFKVLRSEFYVQSSTFKVKKNPDQTAGIFLYRDFINLRLSCFLRKLSRVLFERQLELERILHIPL